MSKFWKWMFLVSKKKLQDQHLKESGSDIKCPHCQEWFSVSGVEFNHKSYDEVFGIGVECGKCNHHSYWNLEAAPVPLLCDSVGTPIT